jgi:hypothetical protein
VIIGYNWNGRTRGNNDGLGVEKTPQFDDGPSAILFMVM